MNAERGEIEITLGGKQYVLRPTFEAFCEIEAELGDKLLPLVRRFYTGSVGLRDVATVIYHGMKAAGSKVTLNEVGEMLVDDGINDFLGPVGMFLGTPLKANDEGTTEGNGSAPASQATIQ